MIRIDENIQILESEIEFIATLSPGPGGQNVNKTATAIQLRYDLSASSSLPERVRERLLVLARKRINNEGILVIEANRYRSQDENRCDAIERLVDLIKQAQMEPKTRIKTQPSNKARQIRLTEKRYKSILKKLRKRIYHNDL